MKQAAFTLGDAMGFQRLKAIKKHLPFAEKVERPAPTTSLKKLDESYPCEFCGREPIGHPVGQCLKPRNASKQDAIAFYSSGAYDAWEADQLGAEQYGPGGINAHNFRMTQLRRRK